MSHAASGSADAQLARCATAPGSAAVHTESMKSLTRWALRTVALWAIAKALEITNARLKQHQRDRKLRQQAANAAALPRTLSH